MNTARRAWRVGAASAALALCLGVAWNTSASAAPRSVPKCSASDLSAKQTGSGAGMSQPSAYITVTNTSGSKCSLKGYPTITAASTKKGSQSITVSKGNVMNAPSTKPKRIVLSPGGKAWFAIGAATAYDPPVVTFTSIRFATAPGGDTASSRLSLQATAPTGKPFPLGVSAFAPGVGKSE